MSFHALEGDVSDCRDVGSELAQPTHYSLTVRRQHNITNQSLSISTTYLIETRILNKNVDDGPISCEMVVKSLLRDKVPSLVMKERKDCCIADRQTEREEHYQK